MKNRKYKEWEDIYPLTLILTRFGANYIAFNCEEDIGWVGNANTENVYYQIDEWLEQNVHCPYGKGKTVMDAMNNLLESMNYEK